jgi:hypothetical protein
MNLTSEVSRQYSARIAEHMHAVHQVNSWKCRIVTLRLGEAHGVRVNDLKALNDGPCAGGCGCTRMVAGSFMSSTANRSFEPTTRRACSTDPVSGCCRCPRNSCACIDTSFMCSTPILRPERLIWRRVLSRQWSWQYRRSGDVSTGAEERCSGRGWCDLDPAALRRYAVHAPGTDVRSLHFVTDQPVKEKMVLV